MTYETIKYAVNDGVAKIEFNRPDAGNSINRKFAYEFMDVAIKSTIELGDLYLVDSGAQYLDGTTDICLLYTSDAADE
mgnify:CR=1 FL=1